MKNDSLGDRIKKYENSFRIKMPERMPVILRLDGCHFHSFTKGCKKPFDQDLIDCMNDTAKYLCENIQGCKIAYVQSDEISLLLVNYEKLNTNSWFDNNIQKMCSVASSMASAKFTSISDRIFGKNKIATFDCRVFVVPKEEVNNVFIWRQGDTIRNSVQMLARSMFSHKKCNNKNQIQLKEMCLSEGVDWEKLPADQRLGRCIVKVYKNKLCMNKKTGEEVEALRSEWIVDDNPPEFMQDRRYIERYVYGHGESENIIYMSQNEDVPCTTCRRVPRGPQCPIKCDEYH